MATLVFLYSPTWEKSFKQSAILQLNGRLDYFFLSLGSRPNLYNRDAFRNLYERSRIGRLQDSVMGGSNFPGDSIAELDRRFEGTHLHHLAGSPFDRSGMAYYGTSFDNHLFSLSRLSW